MNDLDLDYKDYERKRFFDELMKETKLKLDTTLKITKEANRIQTTIKEAVENHKPEHTKGVELCNRKACQSPKKVYMYNKSMKAWYCPSCARMINAASSTGNPLCVKDHIKLQYEMTDKTISWIQWKSLMLGEE